MISTIALADTTMVAGSVALEKAMTGLTTGRGPQAVLVVLSARLGMIRGTRKSPRSTIEEPIFRKTAMPRRARLVGALDGKLKKMTVEIVFLL